MADYGLAAQIGRGGGNAMAPQPPDMTNRMMQLLQLQQLQQNMMLAREQEGREAALAPLRRQAIETNIRADEATIPGKVDQSASARLQRQSAERAGEAEVGALDYIRTTPPEERTSAERLDALRRAKPGAYQVVSQSIAQARAVQEKARAEGFTAERQRFELQKVALTGMSSLLPAVRDQDSYQTLYRDFRLVDPTGAKLIGPEYTDENVKALRARVQDLSDLKYGTDEQGNQIAINQRTGTVSLLAPAVRPAAPSASTFGNLDQPLANPPVSTQLTGPGAAGLAGPGVMQPPGAAPIIQPRAAAPAAQEMLSPKAEAVRLETEAREKAQANVKREDEERTKGRVKGEFQSTLDDVTRNYRKLGDLGVLITPETPAAQRARTFLMAQAPGVAGVIDPKTGAPMQAIQNLRQSLVSSLMGATGMTAKQIDSNAEMKAYLDSLTSPGQTAEAVVDTFNNMSRRFGMGRTLTIEDLTGKTAKKPEAEAKRPATPALAGQDKQALDWANANPNDPRAAAIKQRLGVQ